MVDGEDALGRVIDRHHPVVEFVGVLPAAALRCRPASSMIDEDPAHHRRSRGEKMHAVVPHLVGAAPDQAHVGFVDERCGLKGMVRAFVPQVPRGDQPQLLV